MKRIISLIFFFLCFTLPAWSNSGENVPFHEWTSSINQSISVVNDKGEKELKTPKNLTTWIFEDGTFIPMVKLQGNKSYSIITDHLGTPTEAYDEEEADAKHQDIVPASIYGETRKETGFENFIPFKYQGQYFDEETGLCYNRFRYYSPDTGMYISQDPIGLFGNNPNFYAYTSDVSIETDAFGLDTIRLRHYTSNSGLAGMKNDMTIKAYDQNTVFAEKSKGKPLSAADAADAADKYGIKKGSARNYVEFDVDADRVEVIKNKHTGAMEYTVKGDVELDKKTTKFVKRC